MVHEEIYDYYLNKSYLNAWMSSQLDGGVVVTRA